MVPTGAFTFRPHYRGRLDNENERNNDESENRTETRSPKTSMNETPMKQRKTSKQLAAEVVRKFYVVMNNPKSSTAAKFQACKTVRDIFGLKGSLAGKSREEILARLNDPRTDQ